MSVIFKKSLRELKKELKELTGKHIDIKTGCMLSDNYITIGYYPNGSSGRKYDRVFSVIFGDYVVNGKQYKNDVAIVYTYEEEGHDVVAGFGIGYYDITNEEERPLNKLEKEVQKYLVSQIKK